MLTLLLACLLASSVLTAHYYIVLQATP